MLEVIVGQWWVLLLVGIAAGTLGGLLGVGGGVIMVPMMVLILALPQKAAQGVSLTAMVPLALVAAVRYWQGSHMEVEGLTRQSVWLLSILVAIGAVLGTLVGTYFAGRINNDALRVIFASFIILVGIWMLIPKPWEAKAKGASPAAVTTTTGEDDHGRGR